MIRIDIPKIQTQYNKGLRDVIDAFQQDFEGQVLHPLADKILAIDNAEYFDEKMEVIEDYYDEWADEHMGVVRDLGRTIFNNCPYDILSHERYEGAHSFQNGVNENGD